MNTLTVIREPHSWYNKTTTLKDQKGHVKAIITNNIKQPKYGLKTYKINGCVYALDWSGVELPQRKNKNSKILQS